MKTPTGDDCLEVLLSLRRRLLAQAFIVQLARALLLVGGGLVILAALERWGSLRLLSTATGAVSVLLALCLAAMMTFRRRYEVADVARVLDQRGSTRDRWTTFLAFRNPREDSLPLQTLAWQECVLYLKARDFRPLIPWRIPRELPWLVVPLLALAIVLWDSGLTRARIAADQQAGAEEVADTVNALQTLAGQAERESTKQDSEELKRVAEALKRSAEQMKADASTRDDAQKSAMRQLSALEQMLKQMQERPLQATPEELKALASAMKEKPLTEAAAQAIEKGDLAKAAEELEALAEQLRKKEDALSEEQVKEVIEQAMERLAQQRQISEALQQLAERLAQNSGQPGATNELLQQIAQLLREMQPQQQQGKQGPSGKGQQMTEEMLKNLLAALQNMKQGGKPQGDPSQNAGGDSQISMQSFSGQPSPGDGDMLAGAQFPSGQPGSEDDTGTTASATGGKGSEGAEKGADLALAGQLGEGESLSQLLPATGDNSQAQRRYRELYEAMAPAAQDAILQEEIPLGSRFFIKRYFEAIRPPQ